MSSSSSATNLNLCLVLAEWIVFLLGVHQPARVEMRRRRKSKKLGKLGGVIIFSSL